MSVSVITESPSSSSFKEDFDTALNQVWKDAHPIPDKYPRYTNFTQLSEQLEQTMISMCTDESNELLNQIYSLYTEQTDDQLKHFLLKQTQFINACDTTEQLVKLLISWIPSGQYYLLHICHSGTCRNPKFQIPHFNFSGISLPDKTYYTDRTELREPFEQMVSEVFSMVGLSKEDISCIWSIEARIALDHYSRAEKREPLKTYHPTTLSSLIKRMGAQFRPLLEYLPTEYHDITVNNDTLPDTFSHIFTYTPLHELKTWMLWKVMKSYIPYSTNELYKPYFAFYHTRLSGIQAPRPLQERAALFVKSHLDDEMSRIYMEQHADPTLQTEFPQFVEKLRATLRQKLGELEWMSSETRAKATEKLDGMTLKVVGPCTYEDYSHFNQSYNSVFNFIDAYAEWDWKVLEVKRNMYTLHNPDKWEMCAMDVNAYYHPLYNEIVFPAGILQKPFYSNEYAYGTNAGGIGAVICHEMTHGFDDQGSQYDKDGYLHEWWTEDDRTRYDSAISPMEQYFNGLSYQGTPLNGKLTQGENLADLGGLKLSLASCPNDEEKKNCLLAWGNTWRANIRDAYAKQMIVVDPHSLPRFRINGILPHVPDFYRLFDVNKENAMYLDSEKRCTLWDD